MKERRKEFIKKAHSAACSEWKTNIEKEFLKLFKKDDLVVGNWYTDDLYKGFLVFITKIKGDKYYGFGFNGSGTWSEGGNGSWGSISNDIDRLATNEEVDKVFEKEAVRLGVKVGSKVKCLCDGKTVTVEEMEFKFTEDLTNFWVKQEETGTWCLLFEKGKWAKIVDTITKEEAKVITDKIEALKNELLNKTIV